MEQEFEFFSAEVENGENDLAGMFPKEPRELIVRLDKWLWAARFFKTRAVARLAIEKGKVFYNGQLAKPNQEVEEGATVHIQQGQNKKIVMVKGLSTRRRSTDESFQLFEDITGNQEHSPMPPAYPYMPQKTFYKKNKADPYNAYHRPQRPHPNHKSSENFNTQERRPRFLRRPLNRDNNENLSQPSNNPFTFEFND